MILRAFLHYLHISIQEHKTFEGIIIFYDLSRHNICMKKADKQNFFLLLRLNDGIYYHHTLSVYLQKI